MKFGRIDAYQSMPMTLDLPDVLFGRESESANKSELKAIVSTFAGHLENLALPYTCFIPIEVMKDAVNYFNEEYLNKHVEATGAIVGYYLHVPGHDEKKIAIGTRFLRASGNASTVTCEFTYEDSLRFSRYCEENKLIILVWIHSHPGFGVRFSGVDNKTLRTNFNADHQAGVVVDNVHGIYNAYKTINGEVCEMDLFGFSLSDCLAEGVTKVFRYASTRPSYRDIAVFGISEAKETTGPGPEGQAAEEPEPEASGLEQEIEELRSQLKRLSWLLAVAMALVMIYSTYVSLIRHPALDTYQESSVAQVMSDEI